MACAFIKNVLCIILINILPVPYVWAGSSVKLSDVKVLTLHHGSMTTGRRNSPVPQLKCIGGTAGCSAFIPKVVQCENKGSDGFDIQWECKTDMDNSYRFGNIQVSCEGYDYPDDPYILKGSCGLEYSIDLTKEGHKADQHDYYDKSRSYYDKSHNYYDNHQSSKPSGLSNFIIFVIICLIGFAIYKTCISNMQYSPGSDDYPGFDHRHGTGGSFGASGPPPPGFRQEYYPSGGCSADTGTYGTGRGTGGGGFWTGAATGGILGYLFGSSNRGSTTYGHHDRWGGSGSSFFGGSSGSPSSDSNRSSGTRTASGFGGTSRR